MQLNIPLKIFYHSLLSFMSIILLIYNSYHFLSSFIEHKVKTGHIQVEKFFFKDVGQYVVISVYIKDNFITHSKKKGDIF